MLQEKSIKCFKCGTKIILEHKVFRQAMCPKCGNYLHCCLNCRLYSPNAAHECRESEARWARDKEAANFCDYFEPGDNVIEKRSSKEDDARAKLNQLFKKGN
jgi:hypothetical protein